MQPLFQDQPPENLCLLRLSAVGDVCNAVPLVRTLQTHWPDTRITWITGELEASLVGDIDGVEFITFSKRDGWRGLRVLRRALRGRRFEILLHMQAALRASVLSLVIPARIRLGFDVSRARDFQWLFTNCRIAPGPHAHVLEGFMSFASRLGLPADSLRWDIPIPEDDRRFAERTIPARGQALVISPCSSQRSRNWRNWRADRYAALADHAARHHGLQIVLTGGPSPLEIDYGREITALTACEPLNLIGKTSLKQLFAVLSRAAALVCPDSGPAHMATAANLPVIGLYASSNPGRTGPYLSRDRVVDRYPDAVRQFIGKDVARVRWGRRVRDPRVMDLIEVGDVTAKLDMVMKDRPRAEA